jgi:hypothetical protein
MLVSFDPIFTIGFHMNSTVKLHLDLNSIVMGDLTNQSVENPEKKETFFQGEIILLINYKWIII